MHFERTQYEYMKIIGLTGGIGSGKTTIANLFEFLNIPVYYSDVRTRFLMENDPIIINSMKEHFGNQVYSDTGILNRNFLGEIIFKFDAERAWINAIVHPAVGIDFSHWILNQQSKFVLKESALLIETLSIQPVDKIILVIASLPIRIQRVSKRDQLSEAEVKRRIRIQISDEERIKFANYIITNDGNNSIIQQTLKLYKTILSDLTND